MLDSLASNKTKSWLDMEFSEYLLIGLAFQFAEGRPPSIPLATLPHSFWTKRQPWHLHQRNINLLLILKEKYWRERKMDLYKLLLTLVMHHTVFELTEAAQCPELRKHSWKVDLAHCYIILMFLLAKTESCILISPTCTCSLSRTKMPQL